jgi:ABC-type uncharacterized transport system permease subunit
MKDFAKTCFSVMVGVILGIFLMTLIRPQPVKAQAQHIREVFVDQVHLNYTLQAPYNC